MSPESKRRTDHTEKDWPDHLVKEGIKNRLFFASPGSIVQLREGTEELEFNQIKQVTWREVMLELIGLGVFDDLGEGSMGH